MTVQFDYADYSKGKIIDLVHEAQNIMAAVIPVEGSNSGEPINIVCQAKGLVQDYKYIYACGKHWFMILTKEESDNETSQCLHGTT